MSVAAGGLPAARETFREELEDLINRHSKENGSDTPDFILARYLLGCLTAFDRATIVRTGWYAADPEPGEEAP